MKKTFGLILTIGALTAAAFAVEGLAPDENAFIQKAAQSDMAEIAAAKLVLQKSSNADIKFFAQEMIKDHGKSTEKLKAVAANHKVTLPKDAGATNQAQYQSLSTKSGAEFDKTYLMDQEKDHQLVLTTFKEEGSKAKDPKLKAFITEVEPVVAHHLDMVKTLRSSSSTKR